MSINKRLNNSTEDYEEYGKYIAATLRRMPKTQTPMIKNIIDQAIFKAEMGELNRGVVRRFMNDTNPDEDYISYLSAAEYLEHMMNVNKEYKKMKKVF